MPFSRWSECVCSQTTFWAPAFLKRAVSLPSCSICSGSTVILYGCVMVSHTSQSECLGQLPSCFVVIFKAEKSPKCLSKNWATVVFPTPLAVPVMDMIFIIFLVMDRYKQLL